MKNRSYKLFIYTALLTFAASIIIPVFWVILASIKENSEFYGSPWAMPKGIFIENFLRAWLDSNMSDYFINSLVVTALSIIILLSVALPASYVLAKFRFIGSKFYNILFMSGLFVNVSYIVVPIFLMFTDLGDVIGTQIFLNNRFILSLVYASTALPFTIYLLTGYIRTIPAAYEEAAMIDGCSYKSSLVKIIIPMAKPSIITVILFNSLAFWNEYIIALTLISDDKVKTLPIGLMNLMKAQNAAAEYGRLYAGLVIVMLPTLILYIIVQKKLLQGINVGGIKG